LRPLDGRRRPNGATAVLKQRIITALVLVAILGVTLTVAAPYGFPMFTLAMVGLVVYEWLLLLSLSRTTAIVAGGATIIVLWAVERSAWMPPVAAAAVVAATVAWLGLTVGLFISGRFPPPDRWRLAYVVLALLMPAACWFALVAAYRQGLVYLVSILAMVWAADVAAYFAGRAFGKRKLAPSISPGKTWAGAIGGTLAALLVAVACSSVAVFQDSFFAVLDRRWSIVVVLAVAFVMVVTSVVGDLFESQLKRQRGVKDSSHLLPGHGGVFDRVDALLPVVPIALLLQLATGH
jgi:phosphatidate cytidylyltransferase